MKRIEKINTDEQNSNEAKHQNIDAYILWVLSQIDSNRFPIINSMSEIDSDTFEKIENYLLQESSNKILVWVRPSDVNRKRIMTTQTSIDVNKLKHKLDPNYKVDHNEYAHGTLSIRNKSNGKPAIELFITDGNHRLGLALLSGRPMLVMIDKTWNQLAGEPNPHMFGTSCGFNRIIGDIESYLGNDMYLER